MKKVSFIIPCYRSEKTLGSVVNEIETTMDKMADRYEYDIFLINDASPDGTAGVKWQILMPPELLEQGGELDG